MSGFISNNKTSLDFKPVILKDIYAEISYSDEMFINETRANILFERVISKMDFDKEVNKYLIILLVFLGLLGTFWGLLLTIDSVGKAIGELSIEDENIVLTFLSLKEALKAPLSGMGTAFATSLFGLAASLSLGFIDLQVSKVQNDFLIDVEEKLFKLKKNDTYNLAEKGKAGEDYVVALLSQTAEGIYNLSKYLEKSQTSKKNLEDLVENSVKTISKINDEINIRNNQYQKVEIISTEHLRSIDNNIETLKNQIKEENILQLEELSSQVNLLTKTISLIKKDEKKNN
ncbi:MAG: hypothetical protein VX089_03290 [Pseudomonadota bacterium]|nr:hypothetical protein [Pseudomonadota bacterium]